MKTMRQRRAENASRPRQAACERFTTSREKPREDRSDHPAGAISINDVHLAGATRLHPAARTVGALPSPRARRHSRGRRRRGPGGRRGIEEWMPSVRSRSRDREWRQRRQRSLNPVQCPTRMEKQKDPTCRGPHVPRPPPTAHHFTRTNPDQASTLSKS